MKKIGVILVLAMLFTACHESLEDRCEREAKEYTAKKCPAKLDKNIRIDSLTFDRATHTLHYHYTLTDFADQDGVMEKIGAIDLLKSELKNSTSMATYKENKYRFRYTYHSEKNPHKIWLDVTFTDKDY
jgi:hypothetical protein